MNVGNVERVTGPMGEDDALNFLWIASCTLYTE